jgi:hypothetical protein
MTENTQRLNTAELDAIERMLAQDVDLPTRAALLFTAGRLLAELRAVIAERDIHQHQANKWRLAAETERERDVYKMLLEARDDHERRLAALEADPEADDETEQEAEICVFSGKRVSDLGPQWEDDPDVWVLEFELVEDER